MSKYYKAEDVDYAIRMKYAEEKNEERDEVISEICRLISDLPSIEVSEDCISRKWIYDKADSEYDKLGEDYDINHMLRDIKNAPSVALLQDDVVME